MNDLSQRDYFTDLSVLRDPYEFFEAKRAEGPVAPFAGRKGHIVTGFAEAVAVLSNNEDFSSFNVTTPDQGLGFEPAGDDISAQIEEQRKRANPMFNLLVNYDGMEHTAARGLLTKLFVPSKLKANEDYMVDLARNMVEEIVAEGRAEIIHQIAAPYVTLVIADLLGVPADDREQFRKVIDEGAPAGNMDRSGDTRDPGAALMFMGQFFIRYVEERRQQPRDDVMTELAQAKTPEGELFPALEVVKAAMFLFAAGQDTSAKLLGNSIRFLCDEPEWQAKLRADPKLIPGFIEEMLRLEGSTKATFRFAKRKAMVGDVEVQPGELLVIGLTAANRDPRRWDDPERFAIGRKKIMEHLAFGRGKHVCIGAPLARAEVKVMLEALLERTSDIRLSKQHHGAAGDRALDYEPSYIIRGLEQLHVELDPA